MTARARCSGRIFNNLLVSPAARIVAVNASAGIILMVLLPEASVKQTVCAVTGQSVQRAGETFHSPAFSAVLCRRRAITIPPEGGTTKRECRSQPLAVPTGSQPFALGRKKSNVYN